MRKPRIKWTKRYGYVEGTINKEISFSYNCGHLIDLRESHKSDTYIPSKTYKANDLLNAKSIASDLLNNLNLDKHEANRQGVLNKEKHFAKTLKDTEDLLEKLKINNQNK